ncbi:MAG TPA: tetratricopeptide repeat protein, partial [bacterium]
MNTNEAGVSKSKSGPVRIVILTVVLIAAFVIALATGLPQIQKFISNPGTIFPDDRVLQGAIEKLSVADARIRVFPGDENAHLERAKSYILLGHLEGAEMEWEEWKDADNPEWGEIGRQVEELRLKTDEIRKLVHEAENSQRPSENYPPVYNLLNDISERYEGIPRYRALFLKGYLLLREGRKAEALDVLTGDVQDYPVLKPYVMYNTGRAMFTDELREDALEYFNEFIAEYPSHRLAPLAILERINILRDLERFDDAISECNRCIENYPSSEFAPKALRKLAEIYEGGFDFDNGAIVRVRLVEEYPESDEVDETLEKFFNGVYSTDLIGDNQKLILGYAGTSGYPRDALSLLSDLVDSGELTSEERSMAAHGAGLCEYYLGHYYDCIDWAKKAIEISPESDWAARAGIRMGHAYLKLDKYENARDAYTAASRSSSELAPLAAEILYEKAYEQKDLDTFENACELIVNEYPDSDECPVAMTWLAYLGCRESEYQTALGYAERCISAFPETASSAEAEFWMARALEGLGRGSEAISAYEDLAARVPWNYWGIRSREILSTEVEVDHVDPYDFSYETLSSLNPGLSEGMELYYTGSLDLALAEFE